MPNYKLPENLTLFGRQFCEIASGKYEPDIAREEADHVRYPCRPDNINGISCKHPKFAEMAASLGGLGLGGRHIFTHMVGENIPPIIPEGTLGNNEWFGVEYVAFSLRDALSSSGKRYAGARHAPSNFRFSDAKLTSLNKSTKKILSLSGSDALIEGMTNALGIEDAARQIAAIGFDYVIPPDYSVFLGECVGMHRLNQVRSLVFAEQLIKSGANVIPHIFPSNSTNLGVYIAWLRDADISVVAINAQMCKSDADRYFQLQIVRELLKALPKLHILVQGGSLSVLKELGPLLPRIHITNRVALHLAMSSHVQTYNTSADTFTRSYSAEPKSLLAARNLSAYNQKWHRHVASSKPVKIPNRIYEHALAAPLRK